MTIRKKARKRSKSSKEGELLANSVMGLIFIGGILFLCFAGAAKSEKADKERICRVSCFEKQYPNYYFLENEERCFCQNSISSKEIDYGK